MWIIVFYLIKLDSGSELQIKIGLYYIFNSFSKQVKLKCKKFDGTQQRSQIQYGALFT